MKTRISLVIALSFAVYTYTSDKVLIITHSYNQPEFIELQHKTFKAFLKDDYEFIVFNDAPNESVSEPIEQICQKLNISCYRIPQKIHTSMLAGDRHSDGLEMCLTERGHNHDGIVFLIDSDMFLIRPFSVTKFMKSYDMAGVPQGARKNNIQISYMWPGLLMMNMNTLPNKKNINLRGGKVHGISVDTGGLLHHYLMEHQNLKINRFGNVQLTVLPKDYNTLKKRGHDDCTVQFILDYQKFADEYAMEFHLDNHFLHYRAGCNWMNESDQYHKTKKKFLITYIDNMMKLYTK